MKTFIRHHQTDLIRITGVAIALLLSSLGIWKYVSRVDFIAIAATLVGGFPMFKEAFEAIRERKMTMELSMSIAVLATLLIGQFTTGLVITLFVLIAELLEDLTVDNGRNVLRKLAELLPQTALIRKNDQEILAPVEALQPDDLIIVKPGSRIPVDGVVQKGNGFVDQSAITGESLQVEKLMGSKVMAGTVNQSGVLEITATGTGRNTTFGKIIQVIEGAQESQAPIEKVADKLAARLVYFALAGALLTFLVTGNKTATISALVVAGACGVAAGTPLAILAGIGRTAREGIIVKGGVFLEQLARVDAIVLDKTGTLTLGKPTVAEIACFNGIAQDELIQILVTGEQHSEHPLAQAILQKAKENGIMPLTYDSMNYLPGKGLSFRIADATYFVGNATLMENNGCLLTPAESYLNEEKELGHPVVFVGAGQKLLGTISITDMIRPEARQAISDIKAYHIGVTLLSGDAEPVVKAVGTALGVDEAVGNLLPAEKLDYIKRQKGAGKKVAMVGDGINDAPALVEANVGIAMGAGTDIAFESADMILTTNNLQKIGIAIGISRQCMNVIRFNFWGTIVVDSAGVVLAFSGLLSPMGAALIHVGSEMFFILNSARLFRKDSL